MYGFLALISVLHPALFIYDALTLLGAPQAGDSVWHLSVYIFSSYDMERMGG
jgi:hypothetical protein